MSDEVKLRREIERLQKYESACQELGVVVGALNTEELVSVVRNMRARLANERDKNIVDNDVANEAVESLKVQIKTLSLQLRDAQMKLQEKDQFFISACQKCVMNNVDADTRTIIDGLITLVNVLRNDRDQLRSLRGHTNFASFVDDAFGDTSMKRAWDGAVEGLRANGQDPEELINKAAEKMTAWSGWSSTQKNQDQDELKPLTRLPRTLPDLLEQFRNGDLTLVTEGRGFDHDERDIVVRFEGRLWRTTYRVDSVPEISIPRLIWEEFTP